MLDHGMMNHVARESLVSMGSQSRFMAVQLLKEVEDHVGEEELSGSLKELIQWVEYLNGDVCNDCFEEMVIKSSEQAKDLFEKFSAEFLRETRESEIMLNISVLKDSFKFWGT